MLELNNISKDQALSVLFGLRLAMLAAVDYENDMEEVERICKGFRAQVLNPFFTVHKDKPFEFKTRGKLTTFKPYLWYITRLADLDDGDMTLRIKTNSKSDSLFLYSFRAETYYLSNKLGEPGVLLTHNGLRYLYRVCEIAEIDTIDTESIIALFR